ncbi:MAG: ferrochelatase [Zoogloeaceae bacterium]|nr:ferrochelatase [Zoogloeaceae bacterium]
MLLNLGSPAAPTEEAVRTYLREFLSDVRIVEQAGWKWQFILNRFILRSYPKGSAEKYQQIWDPKEGSPLVAISRQQASLLCGYLGEQGIAVQVASAMRYGQPATGKVLSRLKAKGVKRFLFVPMYPQYASSTTASALDAVYAWLQQSRVQPEFAVLREFHAHPAYIEALAKSVRRSWEINRPLPKEGRLLMSFHGLPQLQVERGDPYAQACAETARLLAERLANPQPGEGAPLCKTQWQMAFQSKFGKEPWLEPATAETLAALPGQGVSRVDVICPGFAADCLETLEEIALRGRETFLAAGGQEFNLIPALNAQPHWIDALTRIVQEALPGGWGKRVS